MLADALIDIEPQRIQQVLPDNKEFAPYQQGFGCLSAELGDSGPIGKIAVAFLLHAVLNQENFVPTLSGKPCKNSAAGSRLPPGFCNSVSCRQPVPQATMIPSFADALSISPGTGVSSYAAGGSARAWNTLIVLSPNCVCVPGKGLKARIFLDKLSADNTQSKAASSLLILAAYVMPSSG